MPLNRYEAISRFGDINENAAHVGFDVRREFRMRNFDELTYMLKDIVIKIFVKGVRVTKLNHR
jgi:hypothetical protein